MWESSVNYKAQQEWIRSVHVNGRQSWQEVIVHKFVWHHLHVAFCMATETARLCKELFSTPKKDMLSLVQRKLAMILGSTGLKGK